MASYRANRTELSDLLGGGQRESLLAGAPTSATAAAGEPPGGIDVERCISSLSEARSPRSPKGLFFPAAESMGQYGAQAEAGVAVETSQRVVYGIRACELRAWRYLDEVLLNGEFEDPSFRERRESTAIVSCDCADCTEKCCCTLVGGQPYPKDGFDVNITALERDIFIIEVATPRGEEWLAGKQLTEAAPDQLARRDRLRQEMVERIEQQNAEFDFKAVDDTPLSLPDDDSAAWQQIAADCVECGACTHICPTCHCFYLYDQVLGSEQFERVRNWDSCLLGTYHRMAGGPSMKLTPRPKLSSRLANRILHKFVYSPQQYELLGCVGCGRCSQACLGDIDIRQAVKEVGQK